MTALPEPLVPPYITFKESETFPLPLDSMTFRLRNRVDGQVFRAAFDLMVYAWFGTPAACLGDNDESLRLITRERLRWWRDNKDQVLYDFVLCNDGKLYHPSLAVVAIKMWRSVRRLDVSSARWNEIRLEIFERDGYRCSYCGATDKPLDCDHIVPVIAGGKTVFANLTTACFRCNRSKGAKSVEEWTSA